MSMVKNIRPPFQKGQTPPKAPKRMKRVSDKPQGTHGHEKGASFVSQTIRDFAKGQTCSMQLPWCNHDPATTVHCHIREFGMAGGGEKPHDFHGWHGCSECHRREKEAGWDDLLRALLITQKRIYQKFGSLTK